jgi:hypothetical protein
VLAKLRNWCFGRYQPAILTEDSHSTTFDEEKDSEADISLFRRLRLVGSPQPQPAKELENIVRLATVLVGMNLGGNFNVNTFDAPPSMGHLEEVKPG